MAEQRSGHRLLRLRGTYSAKYLSGSCHLSDPQTYFVEQVVIDRILLKRFFSALAGSSVTIVTGLATLGIARSGDNSPEGGEAAPNCSSCPACP